MQATSVDTKRSYISPGLYLSAILIFLLPFVEIRCNNVPVAENSGLGLAVGTDFKPVGEINALQNTFEKMNGEKSQSAKGSGKIYELALAALILGVAGVILSFTNSRSYSAKMIIGVLGAVALIALMIQLKMDVKEKITEPVDDVSSSDAKLTVNFTVWYYLSLACFLIAAFFNYNKRKTSALHEAPPKKAPQISVENPGDQSDFPKSASESEIG